MIRLSEPPVVEIDTEATAAYIRLRDGAVARTRPFQSEGDSIMLDFDSEDNVIGIEVIGRQEFSIRELMRELPIEASDEVLNRTRYVAADLEAA